MTAATVRLLLAAPIALAGMTITASATADEIIEFDVAKVLAELNDTDGDLGFHAEIDGEPWKSLDIKNPRGRVLFSIRERGELRRLGLSEFSFESNEPQFDEQTPAEFFAEFPEGIYRIGSRTIEGERQRAAPFLSHALPAPVGNLTISGMPMAEDCEDGPIPAIDVPVLIDFDAVTSSHPEIGRQGVPIDVDHYEVVIEGDEIGNIVTYFLEPDMTEILVPANLTDTGEEFVKYEVLVQATNGNRTSIESCFTPAG